MALLPVRIYGDPVLRQKARPVDQGKIDEAFRQFILDMGETMYANSGIGLAANQVGDLRRVFVVDIDQVADSPRRAKRVKDPARRVLRTYLNPEILESSAEDGDYDEGCLSIPELEATVYRPNRILVRYRTLEWELREEWVEGLLARVFQHELDHLDGIMFIDRVGEDTRAKLAGPLNRLKKKAEELAHSANA